jgi:hypothetical protein
VGAGKEERRGVNIGKKAQTQQHYDMPYIGRQRGRQQSARSVLQYPSRTDIKIGKRNEPKNTKGKLHAKDSAFDTDWAARSTSLICLPACLPINGFYFSTKVTSALDTNLPITPETAVL